MTVLRLFALILALMAPQALLAHSAMTSSVPADGATVPVAPERFEMQFGDGMRLTAVNVADVALDLPAQSGFATEFTIPLPELPRGTHVLEWRGLSADGHATKGTVTFTID